MTPEETLVLQGLGYVLVESVPNLVLFALFYGIALFFFGTSFSKLMHRGLDSGPRRIIFGACVTSFILVTLMWVTNLGRILIFLMTTFVNANDGTLLSNDGFTGLPLDGGLVVLDIVGSIATQLLPLVGDGIVVWRAWVLCPDRRWVMVLPCLLLLATVATTIYTIVKQTVYYIRLGSQSGGTFVFFFSGNGFLLPLSLVTNIVTTLLIWYKLWTHQKLTKKLGIRNKKSQVEKTIIALIESGVVYCILQAVVFVLSWVRASSLGGAVAIDIFTCIYFIVAATYPSLVVIFISKQSSIVQTYGFDSAINRAQDGIELGNANNLAGGSGIGRRATPGHLSFAAPLTETVLSSMSMTESSVHMVVSSVHMDIALRPQRYGDAGDTDAEKGLYEPAGLVR